MAVIVAFDAVALKKDRLIVIIKTSPNPKRNSINRKIGSSILPSNHHSSATIAVIKPTHYA